MQLVTRDVEKGGGTRGNSGDIGDRDEYTEVARSEKGVSCSSQQREGTENEEKQMRFYVDRAAGGDSVLVQRELDNGLTLLSNCRQPDADGCVSGVLPQSPEFS